MPEVPDPAERNPLAEDCRRCPALVDGRECISWGNGPLDADRWQGGDWTGMAYTSRHSGRRIRGLLADAGSGDEDYILK